MCLFLFMQLCKCSSLSQQLCKMLFRQGTVDVQRRGGGIRNPIVTCTYSGGGVLATNCSQLETQENNILKVICVTNKNIIEMKSLTQLYSHPCRITGLTLRSCK